MLVYQRVSSTALSTLLQSIWICMGLLEWNGIPGVAGKTATPEIWMVKPGKNMVKHGTSLVSTLQLSLNSSKPRISALAPFGSLSDPPTATPKAPGSLHV
jgi:hypothetical protein